VAANSRTHRSWLVRLRVTGGVRHPEELRSRSKPATKLIVDGVSAWSTSTRTSRCAASMSGSRSSSPATARDYKKASICLRFTLDGTAVPLLANASKVSDTEAACLYRADGIGLYRTEFAFFIRSTFPTEEEQYQLWKRAAQRIHPRKIVLRCSTWVATSSSRISSATGAQPVARSARDSPLAQESGVLKGQLRALLRVSAEHPLSVLIPVVGGIEEVRATRAVLGQAMAELTAEGKAFDPRIPLGP